MPQRPERFASHLDALADALAAHGVSRTEARACAAGVVYRLMLWCWENITDTIGGLDAVDEIARADMPIAPTILGRLLEKTGIATVYQGLFHIPLAYIDRPVAVDRRWRRRNRENYDAAKRRAKRSPYTGVLDRRDDDAVVPDPSPGDSKTDLFGDPIIEDPVGRRKATSDYVGTPGHKELVEYWCSKWSATEGFGAKYPFSSLDAALIKQLIRRTDGLVHAKEIIDHYLACRDRFYSGKSLKKLIGDLPRFVSDSARNGTPPGEIAYRGSRSLPDLASAPQGDGAPSREHDAVRGGEAASTEEDGIPDAPQAMGDVLQQGTGSRAGRGNTRPAW